MANGERNSGIGEVLNSNCWKWEICQRFDTARIDRVTPQWLEFLVENGHPSRRLHPRILQSVKRRNKSIESIYSTATATATATTETSTTTTTKIAV